ncbi:MAG TPA: hypothetical protein PLS12_02785 [Bacteroidales bacterium]|nr:hypothetical protein [Bacteroidales bacterium]
MNISDIVTNDSYQLPEIAVHGTVISELKYQEVQITKPHAYNNLSPLLYNDSLFYDYYGLSGAEIILKINNTEYEFIESLYHPYYPHYKKRKGLYVSKDKIKGMIDSEHLLQITYNNKIYFARDYMIPVKAFHSYSEVLSGIVIDSSSIKYFNTNLGATECFFVELSYTDSIHIDTSSSQLYDVTFWNYFFSIQLPPVLVEESNKISLQTRFSDKPDRLYTIKKYSVSNLYQKYTISVLSETIWNKSLFRSMPSNVPTNFSKGAVGFFAACDVYSKQATFKTLLQKH